MVDDLKKDAIENRGQLDRRYKRNMSNADREQLLNEPKERPKILPLPNGPYYLINKMEPKIVEHLQNSNGELLSTIRGVALCRCGASKNKPFCDGTHGTIGFSSKKSSVQENGKSIKDKIKNYHGTKITIHDNRRICSHAAECVNSLPSIFKFNARPWINSDSANVADIIDIINKCPSFCQTGLFIASSTF